LKEANTPAARIQNIPEVLGPLEGVKVGISVQHFYAVVKVWLVVILQGLQLDVDCLVPAVFIAGSCIWPLMGQAYGIAIAQRQKLWTATAAAAAACGLHTTYRWCCTELRQTS
jgi:hypothetical protein